MNAMGLIELGVAMAVVAAALAAFNALLGKGPRGTVWIVAACLFTWASMLPIALRDPDGLPLGRNLDLIIAVLRLCGVVGGVVGIIDALQQRTTYQRHAIAEAVLRQPLVWGLF